MTPLTPDALSLLSTLTFSGAEWAKLHQIALGRNVSIPDLLTEMIRFDIENEYFG